MMKRLLSAVMLLFCALAVASAEGKEKKDWGYLTGSLESNNHIYVGSHSIQSEM